MASAVIIIVTYPWLFIKLAKWLLLLPGAAQASMTWDPAGGSRTCAGRQLAWIVITTSKKKRSWKKIVKWFNCECNTCATCIYQFLPCQFTTMTWNDQILSSLEIMKGKAINFTISFSAWTHSQGIKVPIHFSPCLEEG